MNGKQAFILGVVVAIVSIASHLGTTAFLDSIYDKGYNKGVNAGIEQGKKDAMKDVELSYDMCVKKKGE
jgi:hypothetical protein